MTIGEGEMERVNPKVKAHKTSTCKPGVYEVIRKKGIKSNLGISLKSEVKNNYPYKSVLELVDIRFVQSENRIRGQIKESLEWVSIVDTTNTKYTFWMKYNKLKTKQKKKEQMEETKLDIEEDPVQNKKRVSRKCLYLLFALTVGILMILLGLSLAYVEWNPTDKDAQIQENISLKEDKNNLTTHNETLMNENETFKTENKTLKDDKNNLTSQNETFTKEKENLTTENHCLKENNNNLTTTIEKLRKENENFITENETLKENNNNLMKEKEILTIENNSNNKNLIAKNKTLMEENKKRKTENTTLEKNNNNLTSKNNTVMKENEKFKKEIHSLKENNNNLTSTNNTVMKENEKFKKEIETLKGDKTNLTFQHEQLKKQNTGLYEKIGLLNFQIQENISLKEVKNNLTIQNEKLMKEKETFKTNNEELKFTNTELAKRINDLTSELGKVNEQHKDYLIYKGAYYDLNKANVHINGLQNELNTAKEQTEIALKTRATLEKEKIDTKTANDKTKEVNDKLIEFLIAEIKGKSPAIHMAADQDNEEIVKLLLIALNEENKDKLMDYVMQENQTKYTALHFASSRGTEEIVKLLLNTFSDEDKLIDYVMKESPDKKTALHYSSEKGNIKIVQTLLDTFKENKVKLKEYVMKKDKQNQTSSELASVKHHTSIVKLLEKCLK